MNRGFLTDIFMDDSLLILFLLKSSVFAIQAQLMVVRSVECTLYMYVAWLCNDMHITICNTFQLPGLMMVWQLPRQLRNQINMQGTLRRSIKCGTKLGTHDAVQNVCVCIYCCFMGFTTI